MVAQHSRKKKVALGVIITLVCVVVAVLIGFNLYIRIAYSSFYSKAQEEFAIPGVNNGFICQDLDYYDEGDCWLFSGYSSSEGPSPLYRRDANGETVKFTAELPDGTPYEGHGSGITTSENFAFLTCDEGYLVFDVAALAQAGEGESVRAIDKVDLEITPAFINIENDTLYTGTFHLEPNYDAPEEHHMTTPDGSENAGVLFVYPGDTAARYGYAQSPACVYSLPDKVQGVCELPNGDIVLSTSYGLAGSHLLTYRPVNQAATPVVELPVQQGGESDAAAAQPVGDTFSVNGKQVPLYYFDSTNLVADLSAPPMSEGIEYHDGRIYISEEAASNKYIFGKLYGAGIVYSLPENAFIIP